jgi:hypothetical protein
MIYGFMSGDGSRERGIHILAISSHNCCIFSFCCICCSWLYCLCVSCSSVIYCCVCALNMCYWSVLLYCCHRAKAQLQFNKYICINIVISHNRHNYCHSVAHDVGIVSLKAHSPLQSCPCGCSTHIRFSLSPGTEDWVQRTGRVHVSTIFECWFWCSHSGSYETTSSVLLRRGVHIWTYISEERSPKLRIIYGLCGVIYRTWQPLFETVLTLLMLERI